MVKKEKGLNLIFPAALAAVGVKPGATRFLKYAYSADASAADAEIWDPGATKSFVIVGISIAGAAATWPILIKDGATQIMSYASADSGGLDFSNCPYVSAAAGNKLYMRALAAGKLSVNVWGYIV
jgi:hypothetical protein